MKRRGIKGFGALAVGLVMLGGLSGCNTRFGATLARQGDPVVLTGSSLPKLLGANPTRVVAFAWNGSVWTQVPVQVDQRDLVNPGQIYHRPTTSYAKLTDGTPYKILVYTPPPASPGYTSYPTYTPADSDPTLDANDEVTFLGSQLGQQAPAGNDPAGVTASTRQQVAAADPLAPSTSGYVYLYTSSTLTGGGAGTEGVSYTFSLDSGDYLTTYKMGTASLAPNNVAGTNPEHSVISTASYRQTYADRWLNDGLQITNNGTLGPDLLDRAIYPVPGSCGRNEDTYDYYAPSSPYEGAFITNLVGPVRAIRAHIGANSYTWTTQTETFYPTREDSRIDLRGHAGLPGYAGYDDFTTGLAGLTYSDNLNTNLPIDGVPDTFTSMTSVTPATGPNLWQLVTGPAGSLVTTRKLDITITGARVSTYFNDRLNPAPVPCTGDSASWGDAGTVILAPTGTSFVNTDPTLGANPPTFVATRYRYFSGPGQSAAGAIALANQAASPITTTVS